jgi:hypothetical protein
MNVRMKALVVLIASFLLAMNVTAAEPVLISIGTIPGTYEDFATQTARPLENGVPGNRLGGMGPNAVSFNSCDDDTVSYINRFHTVRLNLSPSDPGSKYPMTLTPMVTGTTLLYSGSPLVYGLGCGSIGDGEPVLNLHDEVYYFTGRSDGFDPRVFSTDPHNARFDSESIRVSNDRKHVYISDEYGPYVYEFDRLTGERTRFFTLPVKFAVANQSSMGSVEISGNTVGRVANKGMEGLAVTPDGKTLVGAMQSPLAQDGGDVKGGVTRIITIDIASGVTHEYAYQLDPATKTTVSDILAINNHQFLVDERDSKGRADAVGSQAAFKKLYVVDILGARDVSDVSGFTGPASAPVAAIASSAMPKTLFLDIVHALTIAPASLAPADIPAKLEGVTFGQDVVVQDPATHQNVFRHTIFVGNDNDFLATLAPPVGNGDNPNQFFVFSFSDADLPGLLPQQFTSQSTDPGPELCQASLYWTDSSSHPVSAIPSGSSATEHWQVTGADSVWGECTGLAGHSIAAGPHDYTFANLTKTMVCKVTGFIGSEARCSGSATVTVQ